MRTPGLATSFRNARFPLLLAACAGLRAVLVLRGGQLFWPDEMRYYRSCAMLDLLSQGDFLGALSLPARYAEHSFFIVIGCAAAAVQRAVMTLLGQSFETTLWAPALALSSASVACVALVRGLALKAGADEDEALLCALLMAGANSMFYYSRHLLPYDCSLALILAAFYLVLGEKLSPVRSALCGLGLGLGFMTYNGNWPACASVLCLHLWPRRKSAVEFPRAAAAAGAGLAVPAAWMSLVSAAAGIPPYLMRMSGYAGAQVTDLQGDMAEGWSLPWEYLWHAEHWLSVAWVAGLAATSWLCAGHAAPRRARGRLWLAGAGLIYLFLAGPSTGLGRLGVYARTSRELVPFLCLAAGFAASQTLRGRGKAWLRAVLLGGLALQVAYNFLQPLLQVWPRDVANRLAGKVICDFTVTGPAAAPTASGCPSLFRKEETARPPARLVLLNVSHLFPIQGPKKAPEGKTLYATAHPLQFAPYPYEGFTPEMRRLTRETDIAIRLVDTAASAGKSP